MDRRTFEIYRDGKGQIQERIREAVRAFYARHRCLPAVVVVHPSEAEKAAKALRALALKVPLETVGGCLVPEVWLGVPDEG